MRTLTWPARVCCSRIRKWSCGMAASGSLRGISKSRAIVN
ncbi:hypothetical protein RBY4I_563 [Rhodobacterales bacterium Y4I]|nr:hypothetical protein RBY4I_563 [Rhodobacterales bacterium Y4I]